MAASTIWAAASHHAVAVNGLSSSIFLRHKVHNGSCNNPLFVAAAAAQQHAAPQRTSGYLSVHARWTIRSTSCCIVLCKKASPCDDCTTATAVCMASIRNVGSPCPADFSALLQTGTTSALHPFTIAGRVRNNPWTTANAATRTPPAALAERGCKERIGTRTRRSHVGADCWREGSRAHVKRIQSTHTRRHAVDKRGGVSRLLWRDRVVVVLL